MHLTESPVKTRSVAFLLGIASVAAFAPFGGFPLIWLTLGGLFALLETAADRNASARDGALIGWFFGFGFFLAGISWIYVSLSLFGGMPAPVAGFATVLFCAAMALYPALAGAAFVRFAPLASWQRGLFFAAIEMLQQRAGADVGALLHQIQQFQQQLDPGQAQAADGVVAFQAGSQRGLLQQQGDGRAHEAALLHGRNRSATRREAG